MNRRNLLKNGLTLASGSLLASQASARKLTHETPKQTTSANAKPDGCKLGTLEVSSIGLGVQNMSRPYQTGPK